MCSATAWLERVKGGGGDQFVEVLREIERCQLPLALPQFVFGLPPFQQGLPLFRCQLPDPSPAQVLFRCPVDALVGQARWSTRAAWPCCWRWAFCTSAHRCRVSSSRSSVPALSFRQPPSSGCLPLYRLKYCAGSRAMPSSVRSEYMRWACGCSPPASAAPGLWIAHWWACRSPISCRMKSKTSSCRCAGFSSRGRAISISR